MPRRWFVGLKVVPKMRHWVFMRSKTRLRATDMMFETDSVITATMKMRECRGEVTFTDGDAREKLGACKAYMTRDFLLYAGLELELSFFFPRNKSSSSPCCLHLPATNSAEESCSGLPAP